jgi:hypothetical protein
VSQEPFILSVPDTPGRGLLTLCARVLAAGTGHGRRMDAASGDTGAVNLSWKGGASVGAGFKTEGAIAAQGNGRNPCPMSPTRSRIQLPAPHTTHRVLDSPARQPLCTDGRR